MARNSSDFLTRKNNKLEAFLKKNVDADTFEKIRTYESCIHEKTYKHVIVSDEWLYLTENPPKKIHEAVHLKDIISVELVNDFPDFLSGEERENCQHIVIKHYDYKKHKSRGALKSGSRSAQNSPHRPASSRLARNSIAVDRLAYSAREPNDRKASLQLNSLTSRSLPERHVQFSKSSNYSNLLNVPGAEKDPGLPLSARSARTNSLDPATLKRALEGRSGFSSPYASPRTPRHRSNQLLGSDSPRQLPTLNKSAKANALKKPASYPLLNGDVHSTLHEIVSDASDEEENGEVTLVVPSITVPPLDLPRSNSDGDDESISTLSTTLGTDDVFDESLLGSDIKRIKTSLHLYILRTTSPLLTLTKSAWNNYLIRATYEEDPDYVFRRDAFATGKPKGTSEKLEQLFCQLRNELLSPTNSMEDTFHLLSELKSAAERTFAIKKLFWKNSELFLFLTQLLRKYITSSKALKTKNVERAKEQRADEFELIILAMDTLAIMFRETETLPSRVNILKGSKGKVAMELIFLLTSFPVLPDGQPDEKSHRKGDQWKSYSDIELKDLCDEFNCVVTRVLFELILVLHQDNSSSFFTICWLVDRIDELEDMDRFIDRLLQSTMNLISPEEKEELKPAEAVQLYTQFYVLQTLVEYSARVTTFIRNNFYEEFKYYIQAPVISCKLPSRYMITKFTLELMEKVISVVLHQEIKLTQSQ